MAEIHCIAPYPSTPQILKEAGHRSLQTCRTFLRQPMTEVHHIALCASQVQAGETTAAAAEGGGEAAEANASTYAVVSAKGFAGIV